MIYHVQRLLQAVGGHGQLVLPVKAFSSEVAAKQAAELRTSALRDLLGCRLIQQTGPQSGNDTGIVLGQFLTELGIAGFQHFISQIETHEAEVLAAPDRRIVIPGRN